MDKVTEAITLMTPIVMTSEEIQLRKIADEINHTHRMVELQFKQGFEDICRIGELLLEAKQHVKRAGFGWMDWVEDNLDITKQQANKYIRILERQDDLLKTESPLSISGFSIEGAIKHLAEVDRENNQKNKLQPLPIAPHWEGQYELNNIYVADTVSLEFINSFPPDSVDMIFSDPPWNEKALECYEAVGRLGARILKPGGWCALYAGKMFLPEIYSILSSWLDYAWTLCIFQPDDNMKIQKMHLFSAWRPIVLFQKPGKKNYPEWLPDALRCTRQKDFHEWQQGYEPIEKFINAFTKPGEIVVDPFVGGGTIPWVCKKNNRNFIAFDEDEEDVSISLARLRNESTGIS